MLAQLQSLRDNLSQVTQLSANLQGKREAAVAQLAQIDQQIEALGLDPDTLEDKITQMRKDRAVMAEEIQTKLSQLDAAISRINLKE